MPEQTQSGPPGGTPEKKGMSGGVKVLIGCAVLVVLVGVAGAVTIGVGARFISQKAHVFVGSAERHAEATETLQRLHARYPFQRPEDHVVRPERARAFFSVTDQAWDQARPSWEELKRRAERAEDRGRAGIGDVMAGLSGFHELTMALAEALEAQDMSPAEYVWTGLALREAYDAIGARDAPDWLPAPNVELARQHHRQLAALADDDERGLVMAFAMMYGIEGTGWFRDVAPDY